MREQDVLVTVGVCVHNGRRFIGDALGSALAQTHENLEIVVFDDASTDGTANVVRGLRDPRIVLMGTEENLGVGACRQAVKTQASGQYLTWLDHDDLYLPHRVASLLEHAIALDADLTCDVYEYMTEDGEPTGDFLRVPDAITADAHFTRLFERSRMPAHPLVSRRCYERVEYDESLRRSEDYDFWLGCSWEGFRFTALESVDLLYRIRQGQLSGDHRESREATRRIFAKYSVTDIAGLYRTRGFDEGIIDYMSCLQHIYRGEYKEALAYAFRPWLEEPGVDQEFYRGTLLLRTGRLDEARSHLEKHLQGHPTSPAGQNNMGVLERRLRIDGRPRFEQAVELLPGYVDATHNLAGEMCLTDVQL